MTEYLHTDIEISQTPKKAGKPCGDYVTYYRDKNSTNIILCDGIGSGIKASISARMAASRIEKMLKAGLSMEKTAVSLANTMEDAVNDNLPYSVFSIMKIMNNGSTRILAFNMPAPILIDKNNAEILNSNKLNFGKVSLLEYAGKLKHRESIILMSDGATEAGLGNGLPKGWTSDGIKKFVYFLNKSQKSPGEIVCEINAKALSLSNTDFSDDVTVVSAQLRRGSIANVFTGPPKNKSDDEGFTRYFMSLVGQKIICGGTSADIISKHSGYKLIIDDFNKNPLVPPSFKMESIDLVSEGEITLNQLYNLLDENDLEPDEDNPVTELLEFLSVSDRINFFVGQSVNEGKDNFKFKQIGIIPRNKIVPMIAEKLKSKDKLIVLEKI